MKVDFRVHAVSDGRANVPTKVDGEDIMATVPCTEVELVTVKDRHGTLVLRCIGDEAAEAKELFTADAVISVEFGAPKTATVEAPAEAPAKSK